MLDIRLIREKTDFVRQRLASRHGGDDKKIDEVLALDERRRKALAEVEQLKAARNRVSKEIGSLMARKESAEAEAKKTETRALAEQERDALMLQLPNLPNDKVKTGRSAADNPEVRTWGAKPPFAFQPKT